MIYDIDTTSEDKVYELMSLQIPCHVNMVMFNVGDNIILHFLIGLN